MTIVIPVDYEAHAVIRERHIHCITREQALHEDIRALRIGIINLAAYNERYEACLLHPLGRSVMQIEPVWIRLKSYSYTGEGAERVKELYATFEETVEGGRLDGLIVSGMSGVDTAFEEYGWWPEFRRILRYARNNIPATLGLSYGAQIIAAFMGIASTPLEESLFGVFEARNLDETHRITGVMDDVFRCPVLMNSSVPAGELERERDRGTLSLLAKAPKAGYLIAESADRRFLMHFGHPEFETDTIIEAYRDGGAPAAQPQNFDCAHPVNCWRSHRSALFGQWIKYIHETRTY